MAVTGVNFVRFTRHGLQSIRHDWVKIRHRFELRRQGLKLRWWDERHLQPAGFLFDLSYEQIKSVSSNDVYELRIHHAVGQHNNIRIVFFDPPTSWVPLAPELKPLRTIWILEILQKRRNQWTVNEITRYRNARLMIKFRLYGN